MTKPNPNAREIATGADVAEAKANLESIFIGRLKRASERLPAHEAHATADAILMQALETLEWPYLVREYRLQSRAGGWHRA